MGPRFRGDDAESVLREVRALANTRNFLDDLIVV